MLGSWNEQDFLQRRSTLFMELFGLHCGLLRANLFALHASVATSLLQQFVVFTTPQLAMSEVPPQSLSKSRGASARRRRANSKRSLTLESFMVPMLRGQGMNNLLTASSLDGSFGSGIQFD